MGELPIGIPIQAFGLIVAIGVLIGAALLRRYAEWHGVSDEIIRGLLGWVTVCGFIGAHEFDMIAYNWDKIGDSTIVAPASWWPGFLPVNLYPSNWPLPLKLWEGISSYGGFLGGGLGFMIFVWWKRLPTRLFLDITGVGLLTAFSIGRLGCTVVSDHIGAAVDPSKWYAFMAMDYPRKLNLGHLAEHYPNITGDTITAWNLGLIEFLYLIPVNIFVLWLAFRPKSKGRPNAGMLAVVITILYAPVRFFMDYLRPEDSDPRHLGLTFAQWASILVFGIAIYGLMRILKNGKPAEPQTETSGEMQHRLKLLLKEAEEEQKTSAKEPVSPPAPTKAAVKTDEEKEEEELAKEALAAKPIDEAPADDEDDKAADEPASPSPPIGAAKPPTVKKYQTAGSKKKNKKR